MPYLKVFKCNILILDSGFEDTNVLSRVYYEIHYLYRRFNKKRGEGGTEKQWKLASAVEFWEKQNGGWKCALCCCQLYVAFSFKDLLLKGNF